MNDDERDFGERLDQLEKSIQELKVNQERLLEKWIYYGEKRVIRSHIARFTKRFDRLYKARKYIGIIAVLLLLTDYLISPTSWSVWAFLPIGIYILLVLYAYLLKEVSDVYVILGTEQDEWSDKRKSNVTDKMKKRRGSYTISGDIDFSDE